MRHLLHQHDIPRLVDEHFGHFLRARVNPGALERDAAGSPLPADILREACTLGLTSLSMPQDMGGAGRDAVAWGKVLEQVGYHCHDSSLPLVVSLRASVAKTIYQSGRDDLIDRYAIPMAYGTRAAAFAYTDGTDAFSFKTTATKVSGGYLLRGRKLFVTGGATADTFMVYARAAGSDADDLQVLLVHHDDPGVSVKPVSLCGQRSAGISELWLDDVFVAADRMMVACDGLSHVQQFLNERRVFLVCPIVGRMQAILEDCIADLGGKIRYGNSLTAMQNVQAQLGRMVVCVETARAIVYRALQHQASSDFDPYWDLLGCTAKSYVVDQAISLTQMALRLSGGDGYLRSNHLERYLRDFVGYIPGGGSQDTLTVDLGVNAIATVESRRARTASATGRPSAAAEAAGIPISI